MAGYGQFCPVSKATEVIGEKWTLLILRELLLGTTRFNDFQRALSRISPTLLAKRLRHLEQKGILIRRKLPGQKGYEYRLTAAGKELGPMLDILAVWGMRWARARMTDDELDVEFLMWDLQRRVATDRLPDGRTVLCFMFEELEDYQTWWVVVDGDEVDLCTADPGWEVDLYITTGVRTLVEVWEGDRDLRESLRDESVKVHGTRHLIRTMPDWFGLCPVRDVGRADPALLREAAD